MIDVSKILENVTRFDLSKGMNYNKNISKRLRVYNYLFGKIGDNHNLCHILHH